MQKANLQTLVREIVQPDQIPDIPEPLALQALIEPEAPAPHNPLM